MENVQHFNQTRSLTYSSLSASREDILQTGLFWVVPNDC